MRDVEALRDAQTTEPMTTTPSTAGEARDVEKLTSAQIDCLRAAPIGIEDASGNDPDKGGTYRYQGADGRVARGLWARGLLTHREISPHGRSGGLLIRTAAGDTALIARTETDGGRNAE